MDETVLILVLVVAGVLIGMFFLFREIFCWYYRINERVDLQKETNRLLKKIAGELPVNRDQPKKQEPPVKPN